MSQRSSLFGVARNTASSARWRNSRDRVSSSGFGVGATYALSKRTKVYGGFRSHNVKDGAGTKTADTRLFAVGLRHDF